MQDATADNGSATSAGGELANGERGTILFEVQAQEKFLARFILDAILSLDGVTYATHWTDGEGVDGSEGVVHFEVYSTIDPEMLWRDAMSRLARKFDNVEMA